MFDELDDVGLMARRLNGRKECDESGGAEKTRVLDVFHGAFFQEQCVDFFTGVV